MNIKLILSIATAVTLLFAYDRVNAQDDLSKLMEEQTRNTKSEPVIATFKTTRIINAQSIETVKNRTLDFRVAHRFGPIGTTGGGKHTLYGFDASSDIRLAFEYGINDRLTIGLGRCKRFETIQGLVKYRLLQQTSDGKMPLAVTLYADAGLMAEKDPDTRYDNYLHRFNYCTQALIARKYSSGLTFQLMPTWVHRNYVSFHDDENDLFSLGIGGRVKITKRSAIIFDYFQTLSTFRDKSVTYSYSKPTYAPPIGLGWEVETGGHVFAIMFSNAAGLMESDFIPNTTTTGNLLEDMRFSFSISRNFPL